METPKQIANSLIIDFQDDNYFNEKDRNNNAIETALICVDVIIKDASYDTHSAKTRIEFWNKVKTELKLKLQLWK